ncbi:MAG: S41 family peptidase [Synergistales bacterium]|nr:S41 family peptidase [Synergistales bacterium]MDY6400751.1 S41 family peptidase [Synergistales bacterium]MDY6404573.1 S41 family peptidase [Synergistales bacterium]MDY6411199.1 S41 family peptidase [Synergistales bacterium]MDY6413603.1 S41 family peptidase [Synergistales bacterium]
MKRVKTKRYILIFFVLVFFGFIYGLKAQSADFSEADFNRISPFNVRSLWLLRQVRYIIESYQVDAETKPANEDDLLHGAAKGMVEAWKDPYTRFVSPSQLKDEEIELEGRYGGLGMYVGDRDGQILVISPMEDSPAEKAGLKPKDQIVKVDDEVVVGWTSDRVVQKLRGEPDTKVTVWVRREGEDELLSFEITREIINLKSVRYEMLSDDIGYLRLSQFKHNTAADAREGLRDLIKKGMKALILDLRNNGGGLLDASVKIVSMFVKNGLVVETKGRSERANEKYYINKSDYLTNVPMVVLINGGSASASEIVAGALNDRGRAKLIGEKSFGKGSVQTLFPLTDGSGVYVTIARYYTPSGKVIDHVGLSPDIEVKGEPNKDKSKDEQLQRAIEEVKKEICTVAGKR